MFSTSLEWAEVALTSRTQQGLRRSYRIMYRTLCLSMHRCLEAKIQRDENWIWNDLDVA